MSVRHSATSSPPPMTGVMPDWFARRRNRQEALAAAAAAQTVENRPAGETNRMRRLLAWFVGGTALGYAVSLVVHFVLLATFSLIVLSTGRGGAILSTELGIEETGAEEYLDTRAFEVSSQIDGGEEAAEIVETVPLELPEFELQVADRIAPNIDGAADGDGQSDSSNDGGGDAVTFAMPRGGNAVQQGSFTAWTVPANPRVGQDYLIVVEVQIPEGTNRYSRADLVGQLVGTDGYKVMIPDGREFNGEGWRRPKRTPAFRRQGNKARIVFFVRGAHQAMVRDTIQIRSRLLDEHQKLQIVF